MGFLRGFAAPFRGAAFVARHGMWGYLVGPAFINFLLALACLWGAGRYVRHAEELRGVFAATPLLGWILVAVFSLLLGTLIFLVVQPVVGAPFNDYLSEKVEQKIRGKVTGLGFWKGAGVAIVHGAMKLVLYGVALVLALALTAALALGGPAVGYVLSVAFLAYDGFDFPLSRRGATFAGKWRFLASHPGLALGYGVGASLLYLFPLSLFFAPAFCAAGATVAFLEGEKTEERETKPDEKSPLRDHKG